MQKNSGKILVLCTLFMLSGCGYSEDEMQEYLLDNVEDAINNCEANFYGVLMDDGCLEDEFYYNGDLWNCELNRPDNLVDADCMRGELGL